MVENSESLTDRLNIEKPGALESVILNEGLIHQLTNTLNLDENQQQILSDMYVSELEKQTNMISERNSHITEITVEEIHYLSEGNLQMEELLWRSKFNAINLTKILEREQKRKQNNPIRKLISIFQSPK